MHLSLNLENSEGSPARSISYQLREPVVRRVILLTMREREDSHHQNSTRRQEFDHQVSYTTLL